MRSRELACEVGSPKLISGGAQHTSLTLLAGILIRGRTFPKQTSIFPSRFISINPRNAAEN